ncbi:sugar kinase [Microbacterium sp. Au-Mic1]|uniref:sugar kinase n=1 Tax=Microbacterium sp. Au-Mic1 TaxID=2906457 RepID=UPI001E3CC38A|nr:sugar kinase [Microbacterium sp. Au-Mic1]MCE4025612.1 sugar kinase [Microbacterium sp. Au-Mic1]
MASEDVPALIAIGESMAMVAPSRAESLLDAESIRLRAAGAESNVAGHVAALGGGAAWVSALGDDVLGRRVHQEIAAQGVDTRWVSFDATAPTGVFFKDPGRGVSYYRAGSAASRMTPDAVARIPLEQAQVVHLSGITPALSDDCAAMIESVFERVAASGALLSFDVNHRAGLWSVEDAAPILRDLANRADIVFVGRDEAETLWGRPSADDVRALLPAPTRLIVKDGDVGATEFSAYGPAFVPAIPTDVVEPVGAGDAFAGGYLAGLLRGWNVQECLRSGHERAHLVLQSTSDSAPARA